MVNERRKGVIILFVLLIGIFNSLVVVSAESTNDVKYWALIVCGSEGMSFQRNTDYMYHVLKTHYLFDGIYYLSVDPSHPNVNAESTKANVRSAITNWLATRSDDNDVIFIYFSSHGGGYHRGNNAIEGGRYDTDGDEGNEIRESTLGLDLNGDGDTDDWIGIDECMEVDDGFYWDDELAVDLNSLQYGKLIFVRQGHLEEEDGCFGGGFIDDISAPNRVILTATNETQYSIGDLDGDGFSEWSEVFIDALYGNNTHYDSGNIVVDNPINADTNGDGYISIKEAWDYAWNNDDARIR